MTQYSSIPVHIISIVYHRLSKQRLRDHCELLDHFLCHTLQQILVDLLVGPSVHNVGGIMFSVRYVVYYSTSPCSPLSQCAL